MRILLTADLHLNIPTRDRASGLTCAEQFRLVVASENPDAVVVAGDLATARTAQDYLPVLRKLVGNRPLAFCLGNHDHWMDPDLHAHYPRLSDVREHFWIPQAAQIDAVLLDSQNAEWGEITIVGGYGHFDLGMAVPDLEVEGVRITRENYLSGGIGRLFWNDFAALPNCAANLLEDARHEARAIRERLDAAIASGRRILVATHTCPWAELRGHPLGRGALDMLSAYSGNTLVGKVLEERAASIDLAMCGHTHYLVPERDCQGVRSFNVGTHYGLFSGVIFDTDSRALKWCGLGADE